ncbi:hypothetical protein C1646_753076 [Rhizophagus diaphanus]|nr:hypothetical protein C1646_753076 [Rhizophagus diaphanus] [Rhizophagus sp. MUCL 43196]
MLALNFINRFHPEYLVDGIETPPMSDCLCCEEIAPVPLLDPFIVLPCYHILHGQCLMRILKTDFRCPYCQESEFIEESEDTDSSYVPSTESSNEDENVLSSSALDQNNQENIENRISRSSPLQPKSNVIALQDSPHSTQDTFSEYVDELRGPNRITFNSLHEQNPGLSKNSEGRRWASVARNRNRKRIISRNNSVVANTSILTFDYSRQTTSHDANDISATNHSLYQQQSQGTFSRLLRKILHAEVRCNRETQEAVRGYFHLGETMEERLDEIQTLDLTCTRYTAKTRMNDELIQQLPMGITRTQLHNFEINLGRYSGNNRQQPAF